MTSSQQIQGYFSANLEKLKDIAKRSENLFGAVASTATMLALQEQNLLYLLAKEYYTGEGAIFDGGCCTGGCVQSFARGLADAEIAKKDIIYAYEWGECSSQYLVDFLKNNYHKEVKIGDSFLDITRENLTNCIGHEYIKFLPGDILKQEYPEKIEIFFLDVCKKPEINHAMIQLLERCIPGKTVIIQQDFKWSNTPWINISMGYLKEYLEIIEIDIPNTQIFLLKKEIPLEILQKDTWFDCDTLSKLNYAIEYNDCLATKYRFAVDSNISKILKSAGHSKLAQVFTDYHTCLLKLSHENDIYIPIAGYDTVKDIENPFYNFIRAGTDNKNQKHQVEIKRKEQQAKMKKENLMKIIPISQKTKNCLSNLSPEFRQVSEMATSEQEFLTELILQNKPKKVLEVGVAAGGSSVLMLNALTHISDDFEFHSVDYSKEYYRDKTKNSGFIVDQYPELAKKRKLYTNGLVSNFLDEIGDGIDLCLIDTMHIIPGEILDFLMVLPYLKENAIVAFHDTNLQTNALYPDSNVNNLLFSAISGKKFIEYRYNELFDASRKYDETYRIFPNIAAAQLDAKQKDEIWNVFNLLTQNWLYLLSVEENQQLVKVFEKFYGIEYANYFSFVYEYQKTRLHKKWAQIYEEKTENLETNRKVELEKMLSTYLAFKVMRYKVLSKITFGAMRKKYKNKKNKYKNLIKMSNL